MNPTEKYYKNISPLSLIKKINEQMDILNESESPDSHDKDNKNPFFYKIKNRKVNLIYSIFDLEVSPTNILFGFYFPLISSYIVYSFSSSDTKEVFNENKKHFGSLISYLISDINFINEKFQYSEGTLQILNPTPSTSSANLISNLLSLPKDSLVLDGLLKNIVKPLSCPLVLTFNGNNFDWIVLNKFLTYNSLGQNINFQLDAESPQACLDAVADLVSRIFEDRDKKNFSSRKSQKKKYAVRFEEKFYLISKNFITLDLFMSLYESDNLLANKYRIFFENSNITCPPIELFDCSGVDKKNIPFNAFTETYNLNDLYFTYQLFLHPPENTNFLDVIFSRLLFHSEFPEISSTFCSSLSMKDARLAETYFFDKLTAKRELYKPLSKDLYAPVTVNDLYFSYEYPLSLKMYKDAFSGVTDYKIYKEPSKDFDDQNFDHQDPENVNESGFTVTICDTIIQMSVGGIHTTSQAMKPLDGSAINSKLVVLSECDTFTYLDLDLLGFYVVLLLKLYEKTNTVFHNILLNLFNVRNELKKNGDKTNLIYKIITLALSGKLKQAQNDGTPGKLYDPIAYYSMTANGQLTLLEFLLTVQPHIDGIVMVNTDGCTIKVRKDKLKTLFPIITKFENDYGVSFNDRFIVKKAIIFNINKYLFKQVSLPFFTESSYLETNSKYKTDCDSLQNIKSKGFKKREFTYLLDVYKVILNTFTGKGVTYSLKIKDVINGFYSWKDSVDHNTNINKMLLPIKANKNSPVQETKVYYLSKNPEFENGMYAGNTRREPLLKGSEIPINSFMGRNQKFDRKNLIQEIRDDICFFQYLILVLREGSLELDSLDLRVDRFQEFSLPLSQDLGEYCIIKTAQYLLNRKIPFVIKKEGKKHFTGAKGLKTKSLNDVKTFWFETKLKQTLIDGKVVSVYLAQSYPYIVLDCDDIARLYSNDFKTTSSVIKLLGQAINSNSLILSSPYAEGCSNFKIIIKLVGPEIGENLTQKEKIQGLLEIQSLINKNKQNEENFNFMVEEEASLTGAIHTNYAYKGFFINIKNNQEPMEMTKSELVSTLTNTKDESLSEPPDRLRRFIFTFRKSGSLAWRETFLKFTFKAYERHVSSIQNGGKKVEHFYKALNLMDESLLTQYQNSNFESQKKEDTLIKSRLIQNFMPTFIEGSDLDKVSSPEPLLENSDQAVNAGTLDAYKKLRSYYQQEFRAFLKTPIITDFKDYQVTDDKRVDRNNPFKFEKSTFLVLQSLVLDCNSVHGLKFAVTELTLANDTGEEHSFVFSQEDDKFNLPYEKFIEDLNLPSEIIKEFYLFRKIKFSSPCIFHFDSDNRVVSLDILDGKSIIHCFHANTCGANRSYAPISNAFRSALMPLVIVNKSFPFEILEGQSVSEYLIDPENIA